MNTYNNISEFLNNVNHQRLEKILISNLYDQMQNYVIKIIKNEKLNSKNEIKKFFNNLTVEYVKNFIKDNFIFKIDNILNDCESEIKLNLNDFLDNYVMEKSSDYESIKNFILNNTKLPTLVTEDLKDNYELYINRIYQQYKNQFLN